MGLRDYHKKTSFGPLKTLKSVVFFFFFGSHNAYIKKKLATII